MKKNLIHYSIFKKCIAWTSIVCLTLTMGFLLPAKAEQSYATEFDSSTIQQQVIALGGSHSAVINSDGYLYAWGGKYLRTIR